MTAPCVAAEPAAPDPTRASPDSDVETILDQYAATQKALEHCLVVTDARVSLDFRRVPSVRRQRTEFRRDGDRASFLIADRRPQGVNEQMPDALPAPTADNDHTFTFVTSANSTPDGVASYFHFPGDVGYDRVIVETVDGPARIELPMPHADGGATGSFMRGWLPQDDVRIDQTLRTATGARAKPDDVRRPPQCPRRRGDRPRPVLRLVRPLARRQHR